ncbi:MAG: acyltransferase [Burkholderiaceae bacterium]|nr:acyltransferase [Burkholderiaceae bacterium]
MPPSRFAPIDALRGLAALLVVWLHVTEVFVQLPVRPAGSWLYDIAAAVDTGRIGVVLFFAISGFVIPSSLPPTAPGAVGPALRVFAVRRFWRLFPAYWASLAGAAGMAWWLQAPLPLHTLLANLGMLQGWFGVPDALGLYWSLRLEWVFYVLCAGLFCAGALHRPGALAGALVACGLVVVGAVAARAWAPPGTAWPPALVYLPLYSLFIATMFWGALFRRWHELRASGTGAGFSPGVRVLFWLFPLGIGLGPLCVPLLQHWVPAAAAAPLWKMAVAQALGLGLFLLLATRWRQPGRLWTWLGRVSYSLYLFHPLVFYPLFVAVQSGHWPWLAGAPMAAYLALSLLGSIALAAAVYHGIEQPALRWSRRLTAR